MDAAAPPVPPALPAPADPAAELAALRERATSLGAHLHMPDSILKPWVHFKTAPLPILQFNDDGGGGG